MKFKLKEQEQRRRFPRSRFEDEPAYCRGLGVVDTRHQTEEPAWCRGLGAGGGSAGQGAGARSGAGARAGAGAGLAAAAAAVEAAAVAAEAARRRDGWFAYDPALEVPVHPFDYDDIA